MEAVLLLILILFVAAICFTICFTWDNTPCPVQPAPEERYGEWETVHGVEHAEGPRGGPLKRDVAFTTRTVERRYSRYVLRRLHRHGKTLKLPTPLATIIASGTTARRSAHGKPRAIRRDVRGIRTEQSGNALRTHRRQAAAHGPTSAHMRHRHAAARGSEHK